jgi:lysyl-tRNA synthetase, class II
MTSSAAAQHEERLRKLQLLQEMGIDPYPNRTARTHTVVEAKLQFDALAASMQPITLNGRLYTLRGHGAITFADLHDGTEKMQVLIKADEVDPAVAELWQQTIDQGDIVEVTGTLFTTKRGEQTLQLKSFSMLAKCLQPLPDGWVGIADEDTRYRKRYLDLMLSTDQRARFVRKSKFWNALRRFYIERGFIEVDTPVLETTPGGAEARPFTSHSNALDIPVNLRISVGELWQKRLLVANFPKVFEIGRIFRNEGMSFEHANDYTQLESYESYTDYVHGMFFIKEMYLSVAREVYGTTQFTVRDLTFDLADEWKVLHFCDLLKEKFAIDPRSTTLSEVQAQMRAHGLPAEEPGMNIERGCDMLWKTLRKSIAGPAFLVGIPVAMEPLAKKNPEDTSTVERFQVLLGGAEMGKGFSELNDPREQYERFALQQAKKDAGDAEAQTLDADYIEALEFGMPPAFGFGVSERFFSFLEGVSIREAQLFPLMRPLQ